MIKHKTDKLISRKDKISFLLRVVSVYFAGILVIGLLLTLLDRLLSEYLRTSILDVNRHSQQVFLDKYGLLSIPIIFILMPIIEESIFRIPLINIKRNRIIAAVVLSLSIITLYTLKRDMDRNDIYPVILTGLLPALLVIICFLRSKKENKQVDKLIFWSSVLLFGIVHIGNFTPFVPAYIPLYIIFTLPQIFMGYVLAITRVRMGILPAVFLHMIINTPSAILLMTKL